MCFTECYDLSDKNMFLCTIEILPDDLDKIKYKSIYDKPGYGTAAKKGEYFWILRLKVSNDFDSVEVYKPESQSIVFKEWFIFCLYEYAPNKILVSVASSDFFLVRDFTLVR